MSISRHTDAYAKFLEALVAVRKRTGVTQVELADRLDKPQQYVSKSELGDRRLDVVEFVAICRALDVDPKDALAAVLRKLPKAFDI